MRRRCKHTLFVAATLAALLVLPVLPRAQLGQQLNELQQQVINTYRSGNYELAAKQGEQNVAIVRQHLGDRHPIYAIAIGWNATIYMDMGRLDEAEHLFRQSLAIFQKTAPGSIQLAHTYGNLGNVLFEQGRFVESEAMQKTALTLWERLRPADHPDVGLALHNLAAIYRKVDRLDEAEQILKRSLSIADRSQSAELRITVISEFAMLYRDQKRFEEAQRLQEQVVAAKEKTLHPQHPDLAASLHELGLTYSHRNLLPQAEQTLRRTLEIREKVLSPLHRSTAATMNNLAAVYETQGKFSQSETLKKRALAIFERVLPDDHPDLAELYQNLSVLYFQKKDWRSGLDNIRKASEILIKRSQISTSDLVNHAPNFSAHVVLANRAGAGDRALRAETFEIAQRALFSRAGYSNIQMAARQATGSGPLSGIVREQQDMERRWRALDLALTSAMARGDVASATEARKQILGFATSYISLQQRIQREFPEYAALVAPKPLPLAETQKLLRAHEALFLTMTVPTAGVIPSETYAWVVTQSDARWFKVAMSSSEISAKVHRLRCALDLAAWVMNNAPSCEKEFKELRSTDILPFDFGTSHELYAALLGPAADLINDKQLFVVPSGSLAQLPFHVLVTERPSVTLSNKTEIYRNASWLLKRNAVTVLPSVASLKSLRTVAKNEVASRPMIGFGNPLLNGPDERFAQSAKLARAKQSCQQAPQQQVSSVRSVYKAVGSLQSRNGVVNVSDILSQTPLPETADELCAVAQDLGVGSEDIHLGSRINETDIKKFSDSGHLSNYRILHFATHGTLARSFSQNSEPGLLLTPPRQGSQRDDGYLTASEIAGLRLNADLVILSACYTAGGAEDDSDALAGMAGSFFYAGARSMLVSHWAVFSKATVRLITGAVKRTTGDGKLGRAEAIRLSMLDILNQGEPQEANPSYWAPFVLVGEGASLQ